MANQRRHFRYDVLVPLFFETVDGQGVSLQAKRVEIFKPAEEVQLRLLNEKIEHIFNRIFMQNSETAMVFNTLNHRMNFIFWLLDLLMDAKDPREAHDYKFRLREDVKQVCPKLKEGSTIRLLIKGFYNRIDEYLSELYNTVETSVDGKIFLFKQNLPLLFNDRDYVRNLKELAEKGVIQAQVIGLLIEKLNLIESIYTRLKLAYQGISDPSTWPLENINLSASGFSVLTNQVYPGFSNLNIFLSLGDEIIVCRGKIVLNKPLKEGAFKYRVAVEFDFLSSEMMGFITQFVQLKELNEAMQVFPRGVEPLEVERV